MRDMFKLGYCIRMDTADTAELRLYGEIIADMPEAWKWSKEDKSAADFDKAIKEVRDKGAKKLMLRINSPGGVCTEAVAMRSILANAGFDEVNIRIEGLCASAATDIATLPGAHVEIAEGSEYMIHNPWTFAIGNANEMGHVIERLRNIEDTSRMFYVTRTGQSEEQIKEWMDAETWFTAEQAVKYGFADEVSKGAANEAPIVACADARTYAVMSKLYRNIPEAVQVTEDNITDIVEEEKAMNLKELSREQLQEENPELIKQIAQEAVAAERERLADIDALTVPGYEDLAEQAKANGTSALDFQKQVVAAMKQKGQNFLQARAQETAPAADVTGEEPVSTAKAEAQELKEISESIAAYANEYNGTANGMF